MMLPSRPERATHAVRAVALALLTLASGACAGAGPYVWVQDLPPAARPAAAPARVAPGDLLAIQVWKSEQMDSRQRVREDGTIALFFAEHLQVEGLTTVQVAQAIAERLDGVLVAPRINVVLEEAAAEMVSVIGEVSRPGRYAVRQANTILAALSQAGGLTEFARRDRIYVLRSGAEVQRVRVTYEQLTQGVDAAQGFRLRPGDVVIVE